MSHKQGGKRVLAGGGKKPPRLDSTGGITVTSVRQFSRQYRDYIMKIDISNCDGRGRVPAAMRKLVVLYFQKLIGVKCFPGRDISEDLLRK